MTSYILRPLLLSPTLKEDESPLGYLIRLIEANQYKSIRWLLEEGSSPNQLNQRQAWKALQQTNWIDSNNISDISTDIVNMNYQHAREKVRYCPLCLGNSGYWRDSWHLQASFACAEHKVWLVEGCEKCSNWPGPNSKSISSCECGHDLSETPTTACPDSVINMQCFLERKPYIGNDAQQLLMPLNNGFTLPERVKLISTLR